MITSNDILGKSPNPHDLDLNYECFETALPRIEGVSGLKNALKALKTYQPNLYGKFFPKIYTSVDRYSEWRIPHLIAAQEIAVGRQETEYVAGYQAHVNLVAFALEWERCETPTFFVSDGILDAIHQTGIPAEFDFTDFKLPFPALTFVFPKSSNITFKGRNVGYLGISHRQGKIDTPLGEIKASDTLNKIIITTGFYPNTFFGVGYRFDALNQIVKMNPKEFWEAGRLSDDAIAYDENEPVFTLLMLRLSLSLVLAMEAKPELIEKGNKISIITSKRGIKQELWSPNVIGQRYRVQYEKGYGTHASPRTHWRRGHFRQQGHGQRLSALCAKCRHKHTDYCELPDCSCVSFVAFNKAFSDYKTVWIEPTLIAE